MDLKGSLVDTSLKIYPSETFIDFIQTIQADNVPENFLNFIKAKTVLETKLKVKNKIKELKNVAFSDNDIDTLKKIKDKVRYELIKLNSEIPKPEVKNDEDTSSTTSKEENRSSTEDTSSDTLSEILPEREGPYLLTTDIYWLYCYLESRRKIDLNVPYLHELFQNTDIETPRNKILKRNPVLESRCVKLRAQQEAREYRKMTRSVDNVRMRFPDDSIGYQLKQINRQLIAIGQFIISIFAGFLFGFKGVEWMIGYLDFGFRLLLGVMCALIIALAEIYFLAKKLNEELSVPETSQLGGPPKFVDPKTFLEPAAKANTVTNTVTGKEHQD